MHAANATHGPLAVALLPLALVAIGELQLKIDPHCVAGTPRGCFADMILANATIYTADAALPFAAAMAVRTGRVLRVGDYESVKELKGPRTYELNLSGNVVLPGFIDSHVHFVDGGLQVLPLRLGICHFRIACWYYSLNMLQLTRVPLRGVRSKDEFISKVKEATRGAVICSFCCLQGSKLCFSAVRAFYTLHNTNISETCTFSEQISIQDSGYSEEVGIMMLGVVISLLLLGWMIYHQIIQCVFKLVWLSRMDGHMGIANSLAMKIAGIDSSTNDPIGGTIIRTAEGGPTGLLVDTAMKLMLDVTEKVSTHERREALLRASRHALMRGVTTVVDVGSYFSGVTAEKAWQDFSDVYEWAHSMQNMMIRVCLFFPMPTWSRVSDLIRENGRSLSQWIHLGGVKAFLDGSLGSSSALFHEPYEGDPGNYGLQATDIDSLLNRTLESDKSGLQVAIHAIGDKANDMLLDMFDKVVDLNGVKDRRFRVCTYTVTVLQVSDINPLQAIKTAMSRKPPGWEVPWIPAERLTLDGSLKAHTISAAYACFLDHAVGSLSPGKHADFVVLPSTSWDDFSGDLPAHVLATYVSGKLAYP
ncbi:hypothetical protein HU200_065550 [Digitaria exilis]|uniref:Amidohydrolase 3 domain-containing protein n=1 Tax=Digitaria exilis TaxID=1010633 RepID=A0A835DUV5_9POAL|nr:hypothetical protein HU200_065553 [Digitaria exilis]KAF8646912.1 hypothetical protein HU200_065550 [Digitaria exilis]